MRIRFKHILKGVLASIAGILLLLYIAVSLPPVQTRIAKHVLGMLRDKTGIHLSVDGVRIVFFNRARITGAALREETGEDIIRISSLSVSIRARELLRGGLHVRRVELDGMQIHLVKGAADSTLNLVRAFSSLPEREQPARQKSGFGLKLDRIVLRETAFRLTDQVEQTELTVDLAGLEVQLDSIAPSEQLVAVNRLQIEDLDVATRNGSNTPEADRDAGAGFTATGFHAVLRDILVDKDYYGGELASLGGQWGDQLMIHDFSTRFHLSPRTAAIERFRLETSAGTVELMAGVDYPSIDSFFSNPALARLSLEFAGSAGQGQLGAVLGDSVPLSVVPPVELAGRLTGAGGEMALQRFSLQAGRAVAVHVRGDVREISTPGQMNGRVTIDSILLRKAPLARYLPDTLLPSGIVFPSCLFLSGTVDGSPDGWASDLRISTPYGDLASAGDLAREENGGGEEFSLAISTDSFDAGGLTGKKDTIGQVAFRIDMKGRSHGFRRPEAELRLQVHKLEYLDRTYDSLSLAAQYADAAGIAELLLVDERARLHLETRVAALDNIPEMTLELHAGNMDLGALGLTGQPAEVGMHLTAQLTGTEWEELTGNVQVNGFRYASETSSYAMDSLYAFLKNDTGISEYRVRLMGTSVGDSMTFDLISGGKLSLEKDSVWNSSSLQLRSDYLSDSVDLDLIFSMTGKENEFRELDLGLEGTGMEIEAGAFLDHSGDTATVDARAILGTVDLEIFHPFLANHFHALSGTLNGEFSVAGPVTRPDMSGRVTLRQVHVNPSILNTGFTLEEETVSLGDRLLNFEEVTLTDERGNRAVLSGSVDLDPEAGGGLDLSFAADEFLLLDKSAAAGDLFYGMVQIDLDASVTGSLNEPRIRMYAGFDRESEFTFVVPAGGGPPSGTGLVVFEDTGDQALYEAGDTAVEEVTAAPGGFAFTAGLEVTDKLSLQVITDPFTGERLELSGNGNLAFATGPGGQMSLTGTYEISGGTYELILFDVIKKKFLVERGSSLTWNGDVLDATADLRAVYRVRTSAQELLNSSWSGGAAEETGQYGRIPVDVVMHLSGPLLTPDVEFSIRTEPRYRSGAVGSALTRLAQDESELNKQVFSLLLLNRFTDEGGSKDPMAYTMRNTARQSLGNLLTQQLNQFASRHLEGIDLSLQIESYENTGNGGPSGRTDVSLDVSRTLLNDRLTVEVGGRVAVEENGEESQQVEAGDLAGDFSLEYKLTPDGTYRLKAFNRTDYEDEIDGEVTKTGVSFIFGKEFDDFGRLFRRKNRKEEE